MHHHEKRFNEGLHRATSPERRHSNLTMEHKNTGGKFGLEAAMQSHAVKGNSIYKITDGDGYEHEHSRWEHLSFVLHWFIFLSILGIMLGIVNIAFHKLSVYIEEFWLQGIDAATAEGSVGMHLLRAVGVLLSGVFVAYLVSTRYPECSGGGHLPVL